MIQFIISLLFGAIQSGTSVLYGIYGEIITERAGVINLGTEGCMIVGALAGYVFTYKSGSPLLGVLMAALCGGALALIHAVMVVYRKSNQLATGLAIMFLGTGITAFLGRDYVSVSGAGLSQIKIPFLSQIPIMGEVLFSQDILTYISFILCPLLTIILFKSRAGLVIRATGEDEEVLSAYGFNPKILRVLGVVVGGMITAIGGAQLSIAYTHTWIENMTNGRGVIAVALVVLTGYNPRYAMIGAYIFGGAQTLQLMLQAQGVNISTFILQMFPYLFTILAMFIVSRKGDQLMPAELKRIIESSAN